jgi:hypothetical protein
VIAKRQGVSARRGLKAAGKPRLEPMNKNRIEAYTVYRLQFTVRAFHCQSLYSASWAVMFLFGSRKIG